MKFAKILLAAALSAATLGACYGTTEVSGRAYVRAPAPRLEYIGPQVQVVADYDYPVFYSQNVYWRYDNGVWLRSRYYDRGWVSATTVPYAVLRIDRPTAYVRYRVRPMGKGNRRPGRGRRY